MTSEDVLRVTVGRRACRYPALPVYNISKTETDEVPPRALCMSRNVWDVTEEMTPDAEPHHRQPPDFNDPRTRTPLRSMIHLQHRLPAYVGGSTPMCTGARDGGGRNLTHAS